MSPGADDRIIAVGDLVNRGPASEKVLQFFRDTARASSLMGNHERKHIRSAQGKKGKRAKGDGGEPWIKRHRPTRNQLELGCYGRAGSPCPRCGDELRRSVIDGRGTTHCPTCQPRGR